MGETKERKKNKEPKIEKEIQRITKEKKKTLKSIY